MKIPESFIVRVEPDFIVVDKPAGLLSVPGRGADKQVCVVSIAREMFPDIINHPAVHRLDMDTSGLMVLARNKETHRWLSSQFAERRVRKKYIAVLTGSVKKEKGRIELSFRLDPDNRPHQIYDPVQGKVGITDWCKLALESDNSTRVEFIPITGRTHQLRIHASHPLGLGCPISGDCLYGISEYGKRMLLHACELAFIHPEHGREIKFVSEVPF
jgi:tRNA pseudouridine32 synthase/23S rRNA pseudouridine746 synthase